MALDSLRLVAELADQLGNQVNAEQLWTPIDAVTARAGLDALAFVSLTTKFCFHSFSMPEYATGYTVVAAVTLVATLLIHANQRSHDSAACVQLQFLNLIITSRDIAHTFVRPCAKYWPDERFWNVLLSFGAVTIPGCVDVIGRWARLGSADPHLVAVIGLACALTSVGIPMWGRLKKYQLGPAHERIEGRLTSAGTVLIFSGYNAVVEEVMYRGVYLQALIHHHPDPSTASSIVGPMAGVALSLALCVYMRVPEQLMRQNTSTPWQQQDIGILAVVGAGSAALIFFGWTYDTHGVLTFHNSLGIMVQAFVFGEGHRVGGLPQGKQGMVMLMAWAAGLGMLRLLCDGLGLIYVAHVFGDATIGFLILYICLLYTSPSPRDS
eukprot:TRINITY_DN19510_c0_g1_i6.p1 TRINITY_DN19510_c0_g1~~TRINITY_DN19510_c0_g1_i6.p1  ORF type:complete len:381 (+),score=65.28 TRINITY_DN19510_c0_g1_i6:245-1387(+)